MFRRAAPLSACLAETPSVCILHVVPPSRFVPFALPPACLRRVPSFARIACARARVSAPARFARLIARARQRTHLSHPLPPGFYGPGCRSLRRKREMAAPETAFLYIPILSRFSPSQPLRPTDPEIPVRFPARHTHAARLVSRGGQPGFLTNVTACAALSGRQGRKDAPRDAGHRASGLTHPAGPTASPSGSRPGARPRHRGPQP